MASEVYFKFRASVKTDTIQFDGSAISVRDLKNAIKTKCCLRASDFDLKLEDTSGKEYVRENELIPKYSNVIVRRVPKQNGDSQKRKLQQESQGRDRKISNSTVTNVNSTLNLAESNLSEDDKIKIMFERSGENLSSKYYTVKAKAYGTPPPSYTCHKCNQSGHWIHDCPGIKDARGNLLDSKMVKRPTGIPQDFLMSVEPGTPGAYLDKNGRYMVPIKDAEAYSHTKKDKRPFSIEENPPYVPPEKPLPSEGLLCPLCKKICKAAVLVTCCGTSYCHECIVDYCFVDGHHKCPNCGSPKEKLESSFVENTSLRRTIEDFLLPDSVPEISNVIPPASSPKHNTEVVRRVLKPKQQGAAPVVNEEESHEEKPNEDGVKEELKETKEECAAKETVSNDQSLKPHSPSPVTFKPDCSVNKPSDTLPSVVSNTNTLATLPCGNNSLGTENMMTNLSGVTSIYNGAPLVFPSENAAAASLVSLAALSSVGQPQSHLNSVFSGAPLLPWSSMDQLSILGGMNQSGYANPLPDARGKVLSKEEFYVFQRKIAEDSKRRRRRSRSGDSLTRHRRGVPDGHYSRRRDEGRRIRRLSPATRRHRSRSSGSDRRPRNRNVPPLDYETWRQRKERRLQMEAAARPRSPFRPSRRSGSPVGSALASIPRRERSRETSPERRHKHLENNTDKSRLRSPFHGGSPSRRSLEDVSPFFDNSSRFIDRGSRSSLPISTSARKQSPSRERSGSFEAYYSQMSNPEADLDAKALKKLRKERKKQAKRERKLARKAARAAKKAAVTTDGYLSSLVDDQSCSKSRHDRKKRKRRHRREHSDSCEDSDDSRSVSKRSKKSRSKRLSSSDADDVEVN